MKIDKQSFISVMQTRSMTGGYITKWRNGYGVSHKKDNLRISLREITECMKNIMSDPHIKDKTKEKVFHKYIEITKKFAEKKYETTCTKITDVFRRIVNYFKKQSQQFQINQAQVFIEQNEVTFDLPEETKKCRQLTECIRQGDMASAAKCIDSQVNASGKKSINQVTAKKFFSKMPDEHCRRILDALVNFIVNNRGDTEGMFYAKSIWYALKPNYKEMQNYEDLIDPSKFDIIRHRFQSIKRKS